MSTLAAETFTIDTLGVQGRSLESPTVSLSDPSAFDFLGLGTQPIAAGVRVDRRTILTLDTWWRAVDLVSDYVSRCPLKVRRWVGDENNSVPDKAHAAYRLLFQRASKLHGARFWKKLMQAHCSNHGNAYSWIERDGNGTPVQLVPLAPDRTYPVRVNGKLFYITHVATNYIGGQDGSPENKNQPISTQMVVLAPDDVWHLKGLSFDGLQGYVTFDMAAETAGHALATRQYGGRYFANNGEPRVVIELPAGQIWTKEEKEEFVRQWSMIHSGVTNSHRTALLTQGAQAKPFSTSAQSSQLVENRKMSPREIANFHKLPPHKLGDESRTSYNSLELEEYAILNDCLEPWFSAWTEECDLKLLTARQREEYSHFTDFDRNMLIHTTAAEQAKADSAIANNGLGMVDEIRARRGQPPLPDGIGKVIRCPVNIAILHKTGSAPPIQISGIPQKAGDMPAPQGTPKPADQKSRERGAGSGEQKEKPAPQLAPAFDNAPVRAVVRDAAERAHSRLTNAMQNAAKRLKTADGFDRWVEDETRKHGDAIVKIIGPAMMLLLSARAVGESVPSNHAIAGRVLDKWLASKGRAEEFAIEDVLACMEAEA